MALTTLFKRVAKLGGDSKVIKTTTRLGSSAKDVLGNLAGKQKAVTKIAASSSKTAVKSVTADAAASRKVLNPQVVNKGSGIKTAAQSATSRVIKGAGIGGLIALPLAGGGYGLAKLGDAVGEVRQGFKGASPEDLASSRLDIIDKIVSAGGNPAEYGFNEQNLPGRQDGADSPQFIFAGDQPQSASKPSVSDEISKVVLVGGAVAGALLLIQHFSKKGKR